MQSMKRKLSDCEFVFADSGEFDIVAVVCGCSSACARHEGLTALAGKLILVCREDEIMLTELAARKKGLDGDENKYGIGKI